MDNLIYEYGYGRAFAWAWLGSFIPVLFVVAIVIFVVIRKAGAFSAAAKTMRERTYQQAQKPARGRPGDFQRPQTKIHLTRPTPTRGQTPAKPDPRAAFEWDAYDKEKHGACCGGDPWETPPSGRKGKYQSGDDPWD